MEENYPHALNVLLSILKQQENLSEPPLTFAPMLSPDLLPYSSVELHYQTFLLFAASSVLCAYVPASVDVAVPVQIYHLFLSVKLKVLPFHLQSGGQAPPEYSRKDRKKDSVIEKMHNIYYCL